MNSYPIAWRRMESRMKNWRSLHYCTENILYTLYTVKLKICTQRFDYSSSKFWKFIQGKSPVLSVAGLSLSLLKEKSKSVQSWLNLSFFQQLLLLGVSLLAVSNVNNPGRLVGLPYVMWSAHFFVTHIQTEKISSWNGPTVHVCCFVLARASTKTFVSRVQKTAKNLR
jgi:hypothetical protein